MLYLFRIIGLFLILSGCSTLRNLNYTFKGGAETFIKSDYKTAFQSGELDPRPGLMYGLGIGYYGLLDHVNISAEIARSSFSSTSFDVEMDTRNDAFYVDYFFDDQPNRGFFVGLGIGSMKTSLFGDDLRDGATSYTVRGGYYSKLASPATIGFVRAQMTSVRTTHLRRFYFFGSAAEIDHMYVGVELGVIFNVFHQQRIVDIHQAPSSP